MRLIERGHCHSHFFAPMEYTTNSGSSHCGCRGRGRGAPISSKQSRESVGHGSTVRSWAGGGAVVTNHAVAGEILACIANKRARDPPSTVVA